MIKTKRSVSVFIALAVLTSSMMLIFGCSWFQRKEPSPPLEPVKQREEVPAVPEKPVVTIVEPGFGIEEERPEDIKFSPSAQLAPVYFDFDKYDIKPEAKEILELNADILKNNPDVKVKIEGHCDERGTFEYNLALGERRARAVREYLISLGVNASRLYTISYGEERPVDPGHNEGAWAKNRRAQFNEAD